ACNRRVDDASSIHQLDDPLWKKRTSSTLHKNRLMTTLSTIDLEKDPRGFTILCLNRADKNNASNAEMIRKLILAHSAVMAEKTLRFLLLRGRGKHFSAGADLAWMRHAATLDYNANLADSRELAELMHNHYQLKIPTLAVVQGAAFGGALGLISCCDMAI